MNTLILNSDISTPFNEGKYLKYAPSIRLPARVYNPKKAMHTRAFLSRLSNLNIENEVLPAIPYPRDFMLSAVSMAFSSDHVVIIEIMFKPCLARLMMLPRDASRPMHFWEFTTTFIWAANLGTKRSVIEIMRDNDGIILPNRYMILSLVIISLRQEK